MLTLRIGERFAIKNESNVTYQITHIWQGSPDGGSDFVVYHKIEELIPVKIEIMPDGKIQMIGGAILDKRENYLNTDDFARLAIDPVAP